MMFLSSENRTGDSLLIFFDIRSYSTVSSYQRGFNHVKKVEKYFKVIKVKNAVYGVFIKCFYFGNPIQNGSKDGRGVGQKYLSSSFSPVTSTNVGINPQNLLTFSFDTSFATLV